MDNGINISITPVWNIIRNIQEQIVSHLKSINVDTDVVTLTEICASELVENAIKYGSYVDQKDSIRFHLDLENDEITINVANKVADKKNFDFVKEIIDKINECDNPETLYINRLKELMEKTKPETSRLGFYRIAYEGKFNLSYTIENELLTISAKRSKNM